MDYSSIATPPACYADFCLIPVGTGSISVAAEVAEVQKVLKASGLKYTMHSAGTTVGMSHLFLQLPPGLMWSATDETPHHMIFATATKTPPKKNKTLCLGWS